MGDWSTLPCDLLCEIGLKFDLILDVVNFSFVCTSWQSAYSMIKKKWRTAPTSVPWLLLPENTKENPNYLRKLFCPNNRRCYKLELPETFGARCWGTSSGWIVTFDLTLELYVFNPFTRVRIHLPPQSTMPNKRKDKMDDILWLRQKYVDKAYVFDVHDDDFVVVALHGGPLNTQIAFARPGDESWGRIFTFRRCVHDVLRRGTQLIAVFEFGEIMFCDILTFQNSQPATQMRNYLPTPPIADPYVLYRRFYLLEFLGNLLFVDRFKGIIRSKSCPSTCDKDYRTKGFEVYLFNFDTKNWIVVEDLGDVVLFVGNNCSMIVDVSATNNLRRNCIYFTNDETILWEIPTLYGGHDMGIYDLEKKEIEPIYEGDDIRSAFCPTIWFVPKFSC